METQGHHHEQQNTMSRRGCWKAGGVAAILVVILAIGGYALSQHLLFSRVLGEFFDSDGVAIHYVIEGEGDPVILVHGLGANADVNFRRSNLTQALAEEFQVISMDNRGHGLSDKPLDPEAYGIEMVRDVIRLMDYLGHEQAAVVGYSMGGMITLKLTTLYPERLVCASPNAFGFVEDVPERRVLMEEMVLSLEAGEGFGPLIRGIAPPEAPPSERRIRMVNRALLRMNDPAAIALVVRGFPELLVTPEELAANEVPVLSMVGTEDPLRPDVEVLGELMANSEVRLIEGRNHLNAISQEFRDTLRGFIREHYAERRALAAAAVAE